MFNLLRFAFWSCLWSLALLFTARSEATDSLTVVKLESISKGIDHLDRRMDRLEDRMGRLEDRIDHLEDRIDHLDGRMDRLDGRMDRLEDRIDRLDGRIDRLDGRIDWIIGLLCVLLITIIGAASAVMGKITKALTLLDLKTRDDLAENKPRQTEQTERRVERANAQ